MMTKLNCINCNKPLTPKKNTARYCSEKCKKTYQRRSNSTQASTRRTLVDVLCEGGCGKVYRLPEGTKAPKCNPCRRAQKDHSKIFWESTYGFQVLGIIKTAGTAATFTNVDDLIEYKAIKAASNKINLTWKRTTERTDDGEVSHGSITVLTNNVNVCHRYPLKGSDGTTGLTRAANLYIGDSKINKLAGNKVDIGNAGQEGIHFTKLADESLATEGKNDADIKAMFIQHIGEDEIKHFVETQSIHKPQREALDRLPRAKDYDPSDDFDVIMESVITSLAYEPASKVHAKWILVNKEKIKSWEAEVVSTQIVLAAVATGDPWLLIDLKKAIETDGGRDLGKWVYKVL